MYYHLISQIRIRRNCFPLRICWKGLSMVYGLLSCFLSVRSEVRFPLSLYSSPSIWRWTSNQFKPNPGTSFPSYFMLIFPWYLFPSPPSQKAWCSWLPYWSTCSNPCDSEHWIWHSRVAWWDSCHRCQGYEGISRNWKEILWWCQLQLWPRRVQVAGFGRSRPHTWAVLKKGYFLVLFEG